MHPRCHRVTALLTGRHLRTTRSTTGEDWHGALVLVAHGELEIRCPDGRRLRFGCGETLFLGGLPLVALHGRGAVATVLTAVKRFADVR